MTTTNTTSKVKNYQGANSFINKMKDTLNKYGSLTQKQSEAVEKILANQVKVDVESLPENLKSIANYEGENKFVNDIKNKLMTYGTLTDNQVSAANAQIQKESDKNKTVKLRIPVLGETIQLRRATAELLKEKHGLEFNPLLIDVTKILEVSPKAIKVAGKLTVKRGKICNCCAKTLTDEFSMLTGLGKTCAKHLGVKYITDSTQADKFREEYLKRVDEIGEMQVWVPFSQIKVLSDKLEVVLKMIK
jgi:polyhydroxyalkanoate synthesis regulator phasin